MGLKYKHRLVYYLDAQEYIKVVQYAKNNNISLSKMAEQLEITKERFSLIINGKKGLSNKLRKKIKKLYGIEFKEYPRYTKFNIAKCDCKFIDKKD